MPRQAYSQGRRRAQGKGWQVNKTQTRLMEELNFWYALLIATSEESRLRILGLCWAISGAFNNTAGNNGTPLVYSDGSSVLYQDGKLPLRAIQRRPRGHGVYYWEPGHWVSRERFIKRMIRECEQELSQTGRK